MARLLQHRSISQRDMLRCRCNVVWRVPAGVWLGDGPRLLVITALRHARRTDGWFRGEAYVDEVRASFNTIMSVTELVIDMLRTLRWSGSHVVVSELVADASQASGSLSQRCTRIVGLCTYQIYIHRP